MLTSRYMTSVKNLSSIMQRIIDGTAPDKFTVAHLKSIGFKSSNDQGILPLLKDLGFLTSDGKPTDRYHAYRDRSKSRSVLGEAIREAYSDIFHITEVPSNAHKVAIQGKFKSTHNVSDRVAEEQAKTFLTLLGLADVAAVGSVEKAGEKSSPKPKVVQPEHHETDDSDEPKGGHPASNKSLTGISGLRYNIEIHLPATKDPEVFNAIFRSLKEHLLDR